MQHATLTPRVRLGAVPLACALLAGSSAGLLSAPAPTAPARAARPTALAESGGRAAEWGLRIEALERIFGVNGGVHFNSGIPNHAFYLAIEGGANRTSGMSVQGVGAANREQIERIFYRGFTSYLTPSSRFAQARQATLRAASELYGESSAAFRAVSQAWTAVGVN